MQAFDDPVVSSCDETVQTSNTSRTASIFSKGVDIPITTDGAPVPNVTQDLEEDIMATSSFSEEEDHSSFSQDIYNMKMPDMIYFNSQGVRRSPRLANKEFKRYACSMLKKFCAFGIVLTAGVTEPVAVFSHTHACVNATIHPCAIMNAFFDQTLNSIHHMVLAAVQTNNEVYTIKYMLKEDDSPDFIKAMTKENSDHEKINH